MWGRKNKFRAAKEALLHAWSFAFNDRRKKKGNFRRLWQVQISAATKLNGLSYSRFINGLTRAKIELDRKVLADLAQTEPDLFKRIVEVASANTSPRA